MMLYGLGLGLGLGLGGGIRVVSDWNHQVKGGGGCNFRYRQA